MQSARAAFRPSPLLLALSTLLILPSLVFLAAAAARGLCGPPIRALLNPIMESASRMTPAAVKIVFLAMPAASIAIGGATLMRAWTADVSLHEDARLALDLTRRRLLALLLLAVTLLAGLILATVVAHMMTD